jgi:hypothetical protein
MSIRRDIANRFLAREYAKKLEEIDTAAFAWLLDMVDDHDGGPDHAKEIFVAALKKWGKQP